MEARATESIIENSTNTISTFTIKHDRFMAVNILPPRDGEIDQSFMKLEQSIKRAIALGFTHAWVNPICKLRPNDFCYRRDLDTGIYTTMHQSMYAFKDPRDLRDVFTDKRFQDILKWAKESAHFLILVDFAWLYVEELAGLVSKSSNPENDPKMTHSLSVAFQAIDLYFKIGFSGLRIDAASHIKPFVRSTLYTYIRTHHPSAIIFEEVLFDRSQEENIDNLYKQATLKKLFSDFVTSNLYYHAVNIYGALPFPWQMNDSKKISLSNNQAVGFTGNHDHFLTGWPIILWMAAKRLIKHSSFMEKIKKLDAKITPMRYGNEYTDILDIIETIKGIANGQTMIESSGPVVEACLKYLLSFAMDIAHELLDYEANPEVYAEFRNRLYSTIIDRTLASPSGYFFLDCELDSLFQTQRIFTNKMGDELTLPLIRASDLLNPKVNLSLLKKLIENDLTQDNKTKYTNIKNYSKNIPFPSYVTEQPSVKKNLVVKTLKSLSKKKVDIDEVENNTRVWLPYIVDYLRNHPDESQSIGLDIHLMSMREKEINLCQRLDLTNYVSRINHIFSKLQTLKCLNYHTFRSLDNIKIIVRCMPEVTDIILMNLTEECVYTVHEVDLHKIAIWLQSRLFPVHEAAEGRQYKLDLSSPLDGKKIKYVEEEGWYSAYWLKKVGSAFNDCYNCVIGKKKDHQTNLYLGLGMRTFLVNVNVNVIQLEKSKQELEGEAFHDLETKVVSPTLNHTNLRKSISFLDSLSPDSVLKRTPYIKSSLSLHRKTTSTDLKEDEVPIIQPKLM